MILKNLEIEHFRLMGEMNLGLDPHVAFFEYQSACGKTAILDAVAVLLHPVVQILMGELNPTCPLNYGDGLVLGFDDVGYCRIALEGVFTHDNESYAHSCHWDKKDGPAAFSHSSPLLQWARELNAFVQADMPVDYPLFVYYGTSRNWEYYYTPFDGLAMKRSDGYWDALVPHLDYKPNIDWLIRHDRARQECLKASVGLQLLNKAVSGIFTGFAAVCYHIEYNLVCFVLPDKKSVCPISWMSGCFVEALVVIIDMVRRIVTLNPHLGLDALEKTTGIVLLDHLKMLLVPSLQRRFIDGLRKVFPNIQFLATAYDSDPCAPLLDLIAKHHKQE